MKLGTPAIQLFILTQLSYSLIILAEEPVHLTTRNLHLALDSFKEQFSKWLCSEDLLVSHRDVDEHRTTCEIVQARGFPCEFHYVTTYGGYILQLHRIPAQQKTFPKHHNIPVILQTGLIGTSADFIMASTNVSTSVDIVGDDMGIELAKRGYDVWMANNRGNEYGLNHTSLNPKEAAFWEWSFDEISHEDTPAIIDFVRNQTGSAQVHFIGHSQGSAVMFALLAETNLYNSAIASFIAISPITRIGGAKTLFRHLLTVLKPYLKISKGKVFGKNFLTETAVPLACDLMFSRTLCEVVFFSLTGPNCEQLNKKRLGVYTSHMPSSTSAQNLLHFDQLFRSNRFQKYDYGPAQNRQHYNTTQVPQYKLTNITHPAVYVIYGRNDWFVPLSGVSLLKADLPQAKFYEISNAKANHMDPLIGVEIAEEVTKKMLEFLKENEP